ncbi:unnamed protein product [Adineta ricciae]|uniref:Uncharacterized protein n=1 Tax=Adineta ricciae TaxID=249248 RepID=A0A815FFA6_ADIRI|nr:unnamed protein product [Adineta ricciae]
MNEFVFAVLGILLFAISTRRKQRYFQESNIPGPKYAFLLGNLRTHRRASNYYCQLESWSYEYIWLRCFAVRFHLIRMYNEMKITRIYDECALSSSAPTIRKASTAENILNEDESLRTPVRPDPSGKMIHEKILENVSIFLIDATEMVFIVLSFCTYKLQNEIDTHLYWHAICLARTENGLYFHPSNI